MNAYCAYCILCILLSLVVLANLIIELIVKIILKIKIISLTIMCYIFNNFYEILHQNRTKSPWHLFFDLSFLIFNVN